MSLRHLLGCGAAAAVLLCAGASSAAVLASSPALVNATFNLSNEANDQNFLVQFTLGEDSLVDGFGIYSLNNFLTLGKAVTIRIRGDVAGSPGASYLHNFSDSIDTVSPWSGNTVFGAAHFAPIALTAGAYWIGMSGATSELGWSAYNLGVEAPGTQRQYSGDTLRDFTPRIRNLAYSVEGSVGGGVPEPASWALMIGGFGFAGAALRRRRAVHA